MMDLDGSALELGWRYDVPGYRSDERRMRVDSDAGLAAEWRAAAEVYLSALQAAQRDYCRAFFRGRARARYDKVASAVEVAYEPVRTAASRALDEAYAPHAAWRDAMYAADAMRAWTFKRWGATAWVRYQPGGKDLQRLLEAIKEEPRITDVRWEGSAVERAEEVLGEGRFGEWWADHHGHWRYVLWGRAREDRYRPGGTGTAGTGGFGI